MRGSLRLRRSRAVRASWGIDVATVATELSVSTETVRRWIQARQIPVSGWVVES